MLGLSAAPMCCRTLLERINNLLIEVSDNQVGHHTTPYLDGMIAMLALHFNECLAASVYGDTSASTKTLSAPLEDKERVRWIEGFARVNELAERLSETRLTYIADREGDLYDLFVEAPCPDQGADWLVRVQHGDRLLSDGRKLRAALEAAPVLTEIRFERPPANGRKARAVHQQLIYGPPRDARAT